MRCVAVTGANGYVGGLICEVFVQNGWRVVGLSRNPPRHQNVDWLPWSLDRCPLPAAALTADVLVHAAYDFAPRTKSQSWQINVDGTRDLLQSIGNHTKVVLISSMAARPGTLQIYGQIKLALEQMTLSQGGTVIRPGLVWGEHSGGIVGKLGRLSKVPIVPVPAAHAPQYVTMEALLQRAVLSAAQDTAGTSRVVTVVSGGPREFVDLVREVTGGRRALVPVPWRPIYAALRACEMLGARPSISADSLYGLATTPRDDATGRRAPSQS